MFLFFTTITAAELIFVFNCGAEVELSEEFIGAFQVLSDKDRGSVKSTKTAWFFPLDFEDFVVFLYRISMIKKEIVDSVSSSSFFTLYKLVTEQSFKQFFSSHQARVLNLSNIRVDRATKLFRSKIDEQNKERYKLYVEWWPTSNYLYLFAM